MNLTRPPALRTGDAIGLAAPASAPRDAEYAALGIRRLEDLGFRVLGERGWPNRRGYLSAPDERRAAELQGLFAEPSVRTILAVRGGFGALRLLDRIAFERIRAAPRLLVGYSDVSALQLALLARANVPSLAGPMVDPDWAQIDEISQERFLSLAGRTEPGPIPLSGRDGGPRVLRAGEATGPLIAANLTLLTRLIGTRYLPELEGALLLIEDVGEPPYRVDGMLAQLELAGVLEGLSGLAFGRFTGAEPDGPSLSLEAVLARYAERTAGPVVANLPYGHERPMSSFPVGVEVRLTARRGPGERGGPDRVDLRTREPLVVEP